MMASDTLIDKKLDKRTLMYLGWLREYNITNETWRQFYTNINGGKEPLWFETSHYGGNWLDVIRGDIK